MYKIKVNGSYDFEFAKDVDMDIRELKNGQLHVLYQNKSYMVEIVSSENKDKNAVIKINGKIYKAAIEDQYDRLLKELGIESVLDKVIPEITAPMSGLVLKVNVTEGQEIKKGDSLLVLEAMKMENMIKSTTTGIVKTVYVVTGDKVEKNQVLLEFI